MAFESTATPRNSVKKVYSASPRRVQRVFLDSVCGSCERKDQEPREQFEETPALGRCATKILKGVCRGKLNKCDHRLRVCHSPSWPSH
jgi:hypothetical protein